VVRNESALRMDGRILVWVAYVQRLGGRCLLDQILSEIRAPRVLRAVRTIAETCSAGGD